MDQERTALEKTLDLTLTEVYSGHPPHALSVVVIHDQTTIFSRSLGFASQASSTPATDHTIFRVASITKLFTGTMLMQLRDAVCANMRTEPWSVSRRCLEVLAPLVSEATSAAAVVTAGTSWQQYVGRYVWRDRSSLRGRSLDIRIRGAQLVASYRDTSGETEMPLRPTDEDQFRIQAPARNELNGELVTFTRTESGEVTGVRIGSHWLERVAEGSGA